MENSFQAVVDRLVAAVGLPDEQSLATELGFKRSAFTVRKTRDALPRAEIDAFIQARGLNPEWVYEGRGAMFMGKDFAARTRAQAKFDEGLEKFRLNERQRRYMRGLLMAYWEGDEGLLKERLDASDQFSSDERTLVSSLRSAPAQISQAVRLLADYCEQTRPKEAAPPPGRESAIPDPETARMKPAEKKRYEVAKKGKAAK